MHVLFELTSLSNFKVNDTVYVSSDPNSTDACAFAENEYKIDAITKTAGSKPTIQLKQINDSSISTVNNEANSGRCAITAPKLVDFNVCRVNVQSVTIYELQNPTSFITKIEETFSNNAVNERLHVSRNGAVLTVQPKLQGFKCSFDNMYFNVTDIASLSSDQHSITFTITNSDSTTSEVIHANWMGHKSNGEIAEIINEAFTSVQSNTGVQSYTATSGSSVSNTYPFLKPDNFCTHDVVEKSIKRPQEVEIRHKVPNKIMHLSIEHSSDLYLENLHRFDGNRKLPTNYSDNHDGGSDWSTTFTTWEKYLSHKTKCYCPISCSASDFDCTILKTCRYGCWQANIINRI